MYEDYGVIGDGVSGDVYKVYDKKAKEFFAMKCISLHDNNVTPWTLREISLMYKLDHDHIVKLKKVHPFNNQLYLLMEYAGVDLHAYLRKKLDKVPIETIKVTRINFVIIPHNHCELLNYMFLFLYLGLA